MTVGNGISEELGELINKGFCHQNPFDDLRIQLNSLLCILAGVSFSPILPIIGLINNTEVYDMGINI